MNEKHYFMNEFRANITFELRLMLLILQLLKFNDKNISFQDKNSVQSQLISFKLLFRIIINSFWDNDFPKKNKHVDHRQVLA